jgi:predicted DsbA family dithiol-disulfide isomerase
VNTETVNAALMLGQEEEEGPGTNKGTEFAVRILHYHFKKLEDPNRPNVLTPILKELGMSAQRIGTIVPRPKQRKRNEEWAQQGRHLGGTPIPLFIVSCGEDPKEGLCQRLPSEGPTSPVYFLQLFRMCQPQDNNVEL